MSGHKEYDTHYDHRSSDAMRLAIVGYHGVELIQCPKQFYHFEVFTKTSTFPLRSKRALADFSHDPAVLLTKTAQNDFTWPDD
jgi:hypothetical protein